MLKQVLFHRLSKKNANSGGAGFTLVELLVVIFIMGLLGSMVLANFRQGERIYSLSGATRKLVSDLRRIQNLSMSGVKSETEDIVYGYGIYLKKDGSTYTIFMDKNNNKTFQPSDDLSKETVVLPRGIKISTITPVSSGLDIFFLPPAPATYLNGSANPGQSATVTLEVEGTSLKEMVTVTSAGLIQ